MEMIPKKRKTPRPPLEEALTLLTICGRSERDLSERLTQKNVPPEVVQKTLGRLRELGLVNDESLAEHRVEKALQAGQGEERIRHDLRKRGIPHDIINSVFSKSVQPEDEARRAWDVLRKRASRFQGLDEQTLRRRLEGTLARQGYSSDVVSDVIEKFFNK
jgi:regulatory protein